MPILFPADETPPEPVLTDALRVAVLTEMRDHCAPSTFDAFVRSLRARGYTPDPTPYINRSI